MSTELNWIKSSYSTNDGPDCVEVAATSATIHVRDTKQLPGGPRIPVTTAAWVDFVVYATETGRP
ncbi:hypothetical protein EES43_17675 [Streptomyces sp. ADI96-02]|uniref:DUF397 domain-containing protein n=1 Tax=unclassified Streptomyces TaxID=2593676 RepID=UPI000F54CE38|nr:DUF397 domain-containing protein [Streptomyces sp. ADI96-02]RPK60001.1 hypothetical protein EES43_17675 [Streptomyces sp. ADI96-02]